MTLVNILKDTESSMISLYYDNETQKYTLKKVLSKDCLGVYTKIRSINSSYVPEIYSIEIQDDKIIVLEEYIETLPLSEHIDLKTPFTKSQIYKIAINTAKALKTLHKNGVIHKDIKPSNIMVLDDFTVKLIDFNASRNYSKDKSNDTVLLGTKGYAPPEQFGFAQTDFRTDIYSFGATFSEVLNQSKYKLKSLKNTLAKCMEIDPKNRFQNTLHLIIALFYSKYKFIINAFTAIVASILLITAFKETTLFIDDIKNQVLSKEDTEQSYNLDLEEQMQEQDQYFEDSSDNSINTSFTQEEKREEIASQDNDDILAESEESVIEESSTDIKEVEEIIEEPTVEEIIEEPTVEEDDEDILFTTMPSANFFTSGVEEGRFFISFPWESKGQLTYPSNIPNSWVSVKKADGTDIKITGDFQAMLNGDGLLVVITTRASQITNPTEDFYGATVTFKQLNENSAIKYLDGRIFEGFSDMLINVR